MISTLIAGLIQDRLKEQYRGFAMWLYWSEIYLALGLAVVALIGFWPAALALLWYAAFTYMNCITYERRWRRKGREQWNPGAGARLVALAALVPLIFLAGGLAYAAWQDDSTWLALVLLLAAAGALAGTIQLARGGWPDFMRG